MSNHDNEHDHEEIGSNYCPVCGEELANDDTTVLEMLEKYSEQNSDDVRRILIPTRTEAKSRIHGEGGGKDKLGRDFTDIIEESDLPITLVSDVKNPKRNEANDMLSEITIMVEALDSGDKYWNVQEYTIEELNEEVNNDE